MINIGAHMTISKGYTQAALWSLEIGGNTFQCFSRNPRGGKAKPITERDMGSFTQLIEDGRIKNVLIHAPYTMNLCSAKEDIRKFAKEMMADDLLRYQELPLDLYNFHPGSHTNQGVEQGIKYIIEGINEVMFEGQSTMLLLETMSGKGSEIGRSFEELRIIIEGAKYSDMIGVCMDSCHLFSAGYDVVNDLDNVLVEFDRIVGLDRLRAFHLNDSRMPFASNKDRHEKIGFGTLGLDAVVGIINHPSLKHLPFFLETPNELEGYAEEIALLKKYYRED
jgi:deoxyribonuclease-4